MKATHNVDLSSSSQARRALLIASVLSFLGSALGLSAIMKGQVSGGEAAIVITGGVFGLVSLVELLAHRQLSVQKFASVTTVFYTLYLCSGIVCSLLRDGNHENLYVYLVWCFTLVVFNKLVNVPSVGRFLAKLILLAPLILLGCLFSRVLAFFPIGAVYTLVAFCISYLCFGLMLEAVTQYREAYIVERETAKSLRIQTKVMEAAHNKLREQSELLDKAQDAIFVQDMESRILYWNQGAERLFGWTGAEVMGLHAGDVFQASAQEMRHAFSSVAQHSEWVGELSKKHKDGSDLIVESHCTLVRTGDQPPHSILVINTDITERKGAEARIHNLAFHDVLTGLPNRALLRERLEKALLATNALQNFGALLLIDLDDFKTLNDTSGHDVGDCLLQEVATRLKSSIRSSDTAARLGGGRICCDVAESEQRSRDGYWRSQIHRREHRACPPAALFLAAPGI